MSAAHDIGSGLRRPLRVLGAFWSANVAEEAQYRANFIASLAGTLFWLAMAMLTLAVFFSQTDQLGGWSFWEVVVLLGVFNALGGVVETVLRPSIGRVSEYVRTGSLDLVLTKPIDPQFYVSFRRFNVWRITDVVLGFALAGYALTRLPTVDWAVRVPSFLLLFAAASILLYTLWLTLMSLAFWFVDVENLAVLFDAVFEAARYPAAAYPGALRLLFLYIVPIVWTTTVPASALTGRIGPLAAITVTVLALAALAAARAVWRVALRRYTSAGG